MWCILPLNYLMPKAHSVLSQEYMDYYINHLGITSFIVFFFPDIGFILGKTYYLQVYLNRLYLNVNYSLIQNSCP